jgi:hypothetical protein
MELLAQISKPGEKKTAAPDFGAASAVKQAVLCFF